jgi:hypothetical protein
LAILIIPLTAMVAFAIDIGRVAMTTAEIQNAADAGALAGVDQLAQGFIVYNTQGKAGAGNAPNTTQLAAVTTYCTAAANNAIYYAGSHSNSDLASVTVVLGDVEFGYTRSDNTYTKGFMANGTMGAINDAVDGYQFPNTITVYTARGASYNSTGGTTGNTPNPQVGLFFGPVLGVTQLPTSVMARSVLLTTSGMSALGTGGAVLPLALDYNIWNAYIYVLSKGNKNSPLLVNPYGVTDLTKLYDGYTDSNGVNRPGYKTLLSNGSNGVGISKDTYPQLQAFPSPNLTPGSFGWLSLNNSDVNANSIASWITNGLQQSDITALMTKQTITTTSGSTISDSLYPILQSDVGTTGNTPHDVNAFDWQGITGLKTSDLAALSNYVGNTGYLPLFAPNQWVTSGPNQTYVSSTKDPTYMAGVAPDTSGGVGVNANYSIVSYVGVSIDQVLDKGGKNNEGLWVSPAPIGAMSGTFINPGGTPASSTTFSYTIVPSKLTR